MSQKTNLKHIFKFLFIVFSTILVTNISMANIKVHGHRGARALRPENTMVAFDYALRLGVDVLELDLSVTKDDKLVVSHDPYIDPMICLDKKGKKLSKKIPIRELTLKQIKQYDCGTLKNPRFPKQVTKKGEKIPTLSEVFDMLATHSHSNASRVEFNVETKMVPMFPQHSVSPKKFAKLIYDVVKKYKMQKRFILQSFDYRTLVEMKKLDKTIRTSQLTYESLVNLPAAIKSIKADYSSPNYHWIDKETVKKLHKNKIKVAAWTANDKKTWDYLVSIGVDEIITDDPAALIKYLKAKGLRK